MKYKFLGLLLLLVVGTSQAQLPLAGPWQYTFTDDPQNASPSADMSGWKTIESTNLKWNKADLATDGSRNLWIRKTVIIPSSLKKEREKTGALMLYLGRIQQEDAFFFNGKPAGETASGDLKRAYILNDKDILWDAENTFALRIHHWGDASSVEGPIAVSAATPKQIFILRSAAKGVTAKEEVKGKSAVYQCLVKNNAGKTVAASITAVFYNLNRQQLISAQKKMSLLPGDNTIPFPYQSSTPFLKVQYALSIPQYSYTATRNDEFGYADITYRPGLPVVAYKTKEAFSPAQLNQQTIGGWLGDRLKANKEQRLQKVDEPALLAGFINKPGVHPWIGEHVGKFLEAACNTYQNTGDPALKTQIDRTAQQLIAAQLSDGYLGTYDAGSEWTSWDVWSHKYDLLGLLSYYQLSGYKPALTACEKIGDLLTKRFGNGPGQLDIIKAGAHVGMAATSVLDPLTDLYRFTGKKEYLDFCYYITQSYNEPGGPRIISTIDSIGRVDKTANAKAYEMMSNLVGLVKLYRVTGDQQFLTPVQKAWNDIAEKRLYITGTTSSFEHFQDDYLLPASNNDHMGEGCVTTTWLQLNFQLLSLTGDMKYVDELERAVYNHLTGAENPQTGCVSYYTPLMGAKPYGCNITCCMSSVPRGIAMIPLFANGKISGSPSFLFYQPGTYKTTLTDKTEVAFTTQTIFPEDGNVSIEVAPATSKNFAVLLRKPYWAGDFTITVNGKAQTTGSGETISLNRTWAKGDKIDVRFTMPVKVLDGGVSYPGSVALQRGPQILVVDKALNPSLADNFSIKAATIQLQEATGKLPSKWVGTQAYQLTAESGGKMEPVVVVPYADASQTGGVVTTWMKGEK